jgi:hypothetical protein
MRSSLFLLVMGLAVGLVSAGADEKIAHAKKALEPRPFALAAGKYTSADFLKQLDEQTGNVVVDRRQQKSETALAWDGERSSFWPALDKFTARAGCGWSAYGEGGVALIDSTRRSSHVSYHGITRTCLKRAGVMRDLESGQATCTVQIEAAWEPRFEPFYLSVGPVSATYAKGGQVKDQIVQTPSRGQMPVAGRSAIAWDMHLPGPERPSPLIAELSGELKFLGPSKMLTFRFVQPKTDTVLEQDEVSVRLTSVKEGPDRWLIAMQIDMPEGMPIFESYQSWLDNNRVALVRGTGTKEQTWNPEPNETVEETRRRARIQYAFAAPQGKGKLSEWTLVVRTPGRIVEMTAPYRFAKVPL